MIKNKIIIKLQNFLIKKRHFGNKYIGFTSYCAGEDLETIDAKRIDVLSQSWHLQFYLRIHPFNCHIYTYTSDVRRRKVYFVFEKIGWKKIENGWLSKSWQKGFCFGSI